MSLILLGIGAIYSLSSCSGKKPELPPVFPMISFYVKRKLSFVYFFIFMNIIWWPTQWFSTTMKLFLFLNIFFLKSGEMAQ